MYISFSALLNTLLFSSIAILLLCYIMLKNNTVSNMLFQFLSFIITILTIRLFIPIEVPSQRSVYITKIFPDIYMFFIKPHIVFGKYEISILSILLIISICGSIICIIKLFLSYFAIVITIKRYEQINNVLITNIVIKISDELNLNAHFNLVKTTEISSPFIFGLKNPTIVLPDIKLSEEELYYILIHEILHYCHKDLWLRFICELLHIVYWWNPLIYMMRKYIISFQEKHIDTLVMHKLNGLQKLEYISCLIKIAKLQFIPANRHIAAFNNKNEISKRIESLLKYSTEKTAESRHGRINTAIVFALLLFMVFFPNLVIFEPERAPLKIQEDTFTINSENSYYIINSDGKYDLYIDNKYVTTTNQVFNDNLKIYNNKGEQIK